MLHVFETFLFLNCITKIYDIQLSLFIKKLKSNEFKGHFFNKKGKTLFCFCLSDRVSICSTGWLRGCHIDQAGLELSHLPLPPKHWD